MKKYFFFDIDNTLTNFITKQIPSSTIETIEKLKANGHFVAIATGRSFYSAKPVADYLKIDNIVCSGGKGICLSGKLIEDEPLPLQESLQLIDECISKDIPFGVLIEDKDDIYCLDSRFKEAKVRKFKNWFIDPAFDFNSLKSIHKIYVLCDKNLEADISSLKNITHFRYHHAFISIQADEKYNGILKIVRYVNGDENEIVVFGDELNDLDMFLKAPFSIAMKNGVEELKKHASYVTDTSADDGIYKACLHFHWI